MKQNVIVGIIGGKGKMGSLFAQIFQRAGCTVLISDIRTKLSNEKLVQKSDVILVAVPIGKTVNVIKKIVHNVRGGKLLMDITSIKKAPVEAMLQSRGSVIGLHPMFNETTYGPGQTVIMCPERPGKWLPWITNILESEKLVIKKLTTEKHDKIMTLVQGLVHAVEIIFVHALAKVGMPVKDFLDFAGPASELKILMAARILAQDSDLYGQIQIQNPHNIEVQKKFLESMKELIKITEKKDMKKFEAYFKKSAKFLGEFRNEAMKESDWIIANMLEKHTTVKSKIPLAKTGKKTIAVPGP